jgi:hypothetical protein
MVAVEAYKGSGRLRHVRRRHGSVGSHGCGEVWGISWVGEVEVGDAKLDDARGCRAWHPWFRLTNWRGWGFIWSGGMDLLIDSGSPLSLSHIETRHLFELVFEAFPSVLSK